MSFALRYYNCDSIDYRIIRTKSWLENKVIKLRTKKTELIFEEVYAVGNPQHKILCFSPKVGKVEFDECFFILNVQILLTLTVFI